MPLTLTPYLHFRGTTRDAMMFYHSVFGGKLSLQTFKELMPRRIPATRPRLDGVRPARSHGGRTRR
jgi:PhnB protein